MRSKYYVLLISVFYLTNLQCQVISREDKELFNQFGSDFQWGTACAAYQIEGAWNMEGKGPSIWDHYTQKKGKIKNNDNGNIAVDFYHRYKEDIALAKEMNFKVFRFSISWPRILPKGTGEVNKKGIQFYHNVIDECLRQGLEPWITIYHWDLPQELQNQGGWANKKIIDWFSEYSKICAMEYGTKVKNWMIFNEPAAFIGLGYLAGYHAPGKRSISGFLKATHYSCLALAESARIVRKEVKFAKIGTTFSCSSVDNYQDNPKNNSARKRMDALLNRMYIEPSLGLGYPENDFPILKKIRKYMEPGDEALLKFDFDFIGLQNYFRVVVKKSPLIPVVWAKQMSAKKRGVQVNKMGFEIYPDGIYRILKQFSEYKQIKEIIITENGVCFEDELINGKVDDEKRIDFFRSYLESVLKAKREGIPVNGYFVWSLTDNFEWREGYQPRFGLVYIDYKNLNRFIKDSGFWFQQGIKK
jgi:beta-glucosidase